MSAQPTRHHQQNEKVSSGTTSNQVTPGPHSLASQNSATNAGETNPHKAVIYSYLNKTLRVTLADGRTVQGTLDCFDNLGNMILSSASDITPRPVNDHRSFRLGTVLVPGDVFRRILIARPSPAVDSEMARSAAGLTVSDKDELTANSNAYVHTTPLANTAVESAVPESYHKPQLFPFN